MFSYTAFIPRVFSNIKESRIINTFDALQIGSVEHVDLVPKTNAKGESYNMAFVHFAMIYNTPAAENFRRELEGEEGDREEGGDRACYPTTTTTTTIASSHDEQYGAGLDNVAIWSSLTMGISARDASSTTATASCKTNGASSSCVRKSHKRASQSASQEN